MKKSVSTGKKSKITIISLCLLIAYAGLSAQETNKTHVVQKGDTIYSLSRKYGVSVDDIYSANNMTSSSVIWVGQRLTIPYNISSDSTKSVSSSSKPHSSDTYTVQKGDTLYHIATINGITVDELKRYNNISDSSVLKVGQRLKIPSKDSLEEQKNTSEKSQPANTSASNNDSKTKVEDISLPDLQSKDPRVYSSKQGDSSLVWPVKNPSVTYTKGKTSGVQLSAQKNEDVTSIRAGTVMYVGNYRGYGQVVFVQDKTGYIYAYTGLASIAVKKGDYVVFGDALGKAGTDGIKGTSQIMLMVYKKSTPIDPATAPRG